MADGDGASWLTSAEQCTATAKSTGARCTRPVVPGAVVCRFHGGASRHVRQAGMQRVVEADARLAFGRLGEVAQPVDNPFDALARAVGEVVAWKDYCAGRIAEFEDLRSLDDKGAEQINAMISLFERSMDRAVSALATMSKLGIEERLARVNERQADAVIRAVEAGLAEAGVTGARVAAAKRVVARELRALPGREAS